MSFFTYVEKNNLTNYFETGYTWENYSSLPVETQNNLFNTITELENSELTNVRLINGILQSKGYLKNKDFNTYLDNLASKYSKGEELHDFYKNLLVNSGRIKEGAQVNKPVNIREDVLHKDIMIFQPFGRIAKNKDKITYDKIFEFIIETFSRDLFVKTQSISSITIHLPKLYKLAMESIKTEQDVLDRMFNTSVFLTSYHSSILSTILIAHTFEKVQKIKNLYNGEKWEFKTDQNVEMLISRLTSNGNFDALGENEKNYLLRKFDHNNGKTFTVQYSQLSEEHKKDISFALNVYKLYDIIENEEISMVKGEHAYNLLAVFFLFYISMGRGFNRNGDDDISTTVNNAITFSELKGLKESELAAYFFEDNLVNVRLPSLLSFCFDKIPAQLRNRCMRIISGGRLIRAINLALKDEESRINNIHKMDQIFIKFIRIMLQKGSIIYNVEVHRDFPGRSKERVDGYSQKLANILGVLLTDNNFSSLTSKFDMFCEKHKAANFGTMKQMTNMRDDVNVKNFRNVRLNEEFSKEISMFTKEDICYWISRYLYQKNWSYKYYHDVPNVSMRELCPLIGLEYCEPFINMNNQIWDGLYNKMIEKNSEKIFERIRVINDKCHGYSLSFVCSDEKFRILSELINNIDLDDVTINSGYNYDYDKMAQFFINNIDSFEMNSIKFNLDDFKLEAIKRRNVQNNQSNNDEDNHSDSEDDDNGPKHPGPNNNSPSEGNNNTPNTKEHDNTQEDNNSNLESPTSINNSENSDFNNLNPAEKALKSKITNLENESIKDEKSTKTFSEVDNENLTEYKFNDVTDKLESEIEGFLKVNK